MLHRRLVLDTARNGATGRISRHAFRLTTFTPGSLQKELVVPAVRIVTFDACLRIELIVVFAGRQIGPVMASKASRYYIRKEHAWICTGVMMMAEQAVLYRHGTVHKS